MTTRPGRWSLAWGRCQTLSKELRAESERKVPSQSRNWASFFLTTCEHLTHIQVWQSQKDNWQKMSQWMYCKSRRIPTKELDLFKHAHFMVLYSHTKATWKAVVTNDALMEGEYLPQSFKSTSTRQHKKFPAKTAHFCVAPPLFRAGCTAASACIYFRHDFSLQKRSNLLLWLRASPLPPRYLCAEQTDSTTDAVCCHPPLAARLSCLWTKPCWRAAQLLLLSVRRFIQICICFYIHMMCFAQQLLCTGQKESKPFGSPPTGWSGSLSWSSLRRNLDFQTSEQAGETAVPSIPHLGHPSSGTLPWGSRS